MGACSVVRAQRFEQPFHLSTRCQLLNEFDSVQEPSSFILSNMVPMASQFGLSRFVKKSWQKCVAPYGFLYIKHKSYEVSGVLRIRPIISHAEHILRGLLTDISRCLTVSTKLCSPLDSKLEVLTMREMTPFFRKVQKHSDCHATTTDWEIGELDVEDICMLTP